MGGLVSTLSDVLNTIEILVCEVQTTRSIMNEMPNLKRDWTRARNAVIRQYDILIENFNRTSDLLLRIRATASSRLDMNAENV